MTPSRSPLPLVAVASLGALLACGALGCAQGGATPASGSEDASVVIDSASPADGAAEANVSDATSAPDAPKDAAQPVDSAADAGDASETGSPVADAAPPEAGDPAADCLHAGSPPDGGDPSSNAYMQSCGGDPARITTAQNGSPCTIGVFGQHCFLQCTFCKNSGGSIPATLALPCALPINNCCGVLTCGGCGTCN